MSAGANEPLDPQTIGSRLHTPAYGRDARAEQHRGDVALARPRGDGIGNAQQLQPSKRTRTRWKPKRWRPPVPAEQYQLPERQKGRNCGIDVGQPPVQADRAIANRSVREMQSDGPTARPDQQMLSAMDV